MLEVAKGYRESVWKSRLGRLVLLTIVVMIANHAWWTGRNPIREVLLVLLAFALSLGVVSLFDFTTGWRRSRHKG